MSEIASENSNLAGVMSMPAEKPAAMRFYELRYIPTFRETNVVGNVYFTALIDWQGRCREMFLRDHAPGIAAELRKGLCLVTTHCACDYLDEIFAFDEISIRMRLNSLEQNRMAMGFEYVRLRGGVESLVARGSQHVASMVRTTSGLGPTPVPEELARALEPYRA